MKSKVTNLRSCKKCGWVHFAVTRRFAQSEVKKFNEYFNSLSEENRQLYYGNRPSSMATYDKCSRCGGSYKDFEPTASHKFEIIRGCTIGPIIK